MTFARGDARARRSRGRGAVWALRRPPALGDAGGCEMSQASTQTKRDNDMLGLHRLTGEAAGALGVALLAWTGTSTPRSWANSRRRGSAHADEARRDAFRRARLSTLSRAHTASTPSARRQQLECLSARPRGGGAALAPGGVSPARLRRSRRLCRARVAPARGAGARSPRSALIFHAFMGARADGLLLSPQGYTHRRTRADAARHDRVQLLPSRCRRRHAAAAAVEPASETADTAETADAAETATTGATAADVSRHISPYPAISRRRTPRPTPQLPPPPSYHPCLLLHRV